MNSLCMRGGVGCTKLERARNAHRKSRQSAYGTALFVDLVRRRTAGKKMCNMFVFSVLHARIPCIFRCKPVLNAFLCACRSG